MATEVPWSTDVVELELTPSEHVPETGNEIEMECVTEPNADDVEIGSSESTEILYCYCRKPWTKEFMIMCENCRDWFHGMCIGVYENDALDIDKYHCSNCETSVGKTIYKNSDERRLAAGSEAFITKLKERDFICGESMICKERGNNLNVPNLFVKGFNKPILVEEIDELGMKLPPTTLQVRDIERFVSPAMAVEVIQVEKQSSVPMTFRQFVEYFTAPYRSNRLNLISLEVSETPLGSMIEPPYIARKLDWVINSWPKGMSEELYQRPKVSKYCLISSKDSYTDFHIDFGGTSVWYHVLWGEKIFYLIEPTDINIALYERWMASSPQDKYEAFFGDTVDYCYKLVLKKGQTLFIPTGWIHAVFTPMDSLVFGGNFLHMLNMEMQLKIYNMEKNLNIKRRYMFPSFEVVHWLASAQLILKLSSCNDQGVFPAHLRQGTKSLIQNMEKWLNDSKKNSGSELIPTSVDPRATIKSLSRVLRIAEKRNAVTMAKMNLSNRGITAATITAELLSEDPSITSFSGFLLGDYSKARRALVSSSSQDETSSVASPAESDTKPPIKLKFKKHRRRRHESWTSEDSQASTRIPRSLTDDTNGNGGLGSLHDTSQIQQPCLLQEAPLKLRFSLNEAKLELVTSQTLLSKSSLASPDENATDNQADTDDDVFSISTVGDKRKSKSHHSRRHHKKRRRHRKHRDEEQQDGMDSMNGNGVKVVTDDSSIREEDYDGSDMSERRKHKKHKRRHHEKTGDEMKKVYQDDQYIYPSLTVSDDDDGGKRRGRAAQDTDEAWFPGGRVAKSISKVANRPSRPGAKREFVEKGLSDAASTLASKITLKPKRQYKSKNLSTSNGANCSVIGMPGSTLGNATAGTSTGTGHSLKKKKLPKGMATVKQRLSKILKIKRITKF